MLQMRKKLYFCRIERLRKLAVLSLKKHSDNTKKQFLVNHVCGDLNNFQKNVRY